MKKYNKDYIIKEYLKGRNAKEIGIELGTYNTTIRRILVRNGISTRSPSEYWSNRSNPFLNLSSSEVNYWLGILASDGNISKNRNRIALQLSIKDSYLVDAFAKFVSAPSKNVYNKQYNIYERRCDFQDKKIKETLVSYGITSNKSKSLFIKIPITFDFIRGVIDGDGYVRKFSNRATVEIASASEEFSKQIYKFLIDSGIHCTLRIGSICIVGIYTKKYVIKLYHKLYDKATVFLNRKKDSYGPLFKEILKDAKSSNSGNLLENPEPSL